MIVDKFLAWAQTAPADLRAEGASSLARAYLYADMPAEKRRLAEVTLTALLDDPSIDVRRAMAEAFASAADAPHHIIVALAGDHASVAACILRRSQLLSVSELIDCAAIGDALAQSAIAVRPDLPSAVSAALAEVGAREAVITLCVNASARIMEFSMRRILERFAADGEVREALSLRGDVPPAVRNEIVLATAAALSRFVQRCDWMSSDRAERVTREAREKATVMIGANACASRGDSAARFAAYLRTGGHLTGGLMLRALLSGNRSLFEAALSELSGLARARVGGLVDRCDGGGFTALYQRAGLPQSLLPAFRVALQAQDELGFTQDSDARDIALSRELIERVLEGCAVNDSAEAGKVKALLHRFEAEAAREEARAHTAQLAIPSIPPQTRTYTIDLDAIEAQLLVAA